MSYCIRSPQWAVERCIAAAEFVQAASATKMAQITKKLIIQTYISAFDKYRKLQSISSIATTTTSGRRDSKITEARHMGCSC